MRYPSDLTDAEWALVEPMIPPAKPGGRKRTADVRVVGSVNNVADARKLVSESKIYCAVLDVHLGAESVAALIPDLDARHMP